MSFDKIVEVYSAGNLIEAQYLSAALQEAGISCRDVGESLGLAAGCLPLGEPLAIRIWVHEADKVRALKIIQECLNQPMPEITDYGEIENHYLLCPDVTWETHRRIDYATLDDISCRIDRRWPIPPSWPENRPKTEKASHLGPTFRPMLNLRRSGMLGDLKIVEF